MSESLSLPKIKLISPEKRNYIMKKYYQKLLLQISASIIN